jgi:hypothetical protein
MKTVYIEDKKYLILGVMPSPLGTVTLVEEAFDPFADLRKAYAEGKLQWRKLDDDWKDWGDAYAPSFTAPISRYRRKPDVEERVDEYGNAKKWYAEGKLQILMYHENTWEDWPTSRPAPYWNIIRTPHTSFRRKPEPTIQVWSREEAIGQVVRHKESGNWYMITGATKSKFCVGGQNIKHSTLLEKYVSESGCACGKVVEK